jgi:hypothetical protein
MAKGGEHHLMAACGREMSLAQAELSLAQGDKAAAIEKLKTALRFADECVLDMSVNMGGPPDYGPLEECEAAAARCRVELKLADLCPEAIDEARREK